MRIIQYDLSFDKGLQSIRIEMPVDTKLLSIHMHGNEPKLWALAGESAVTEARTFIAYRTGSYIDSTEIGEYVGTYQEYFEWGGWSAFHIFELNEPKCVTSQNPKNDVKVQRLFTMPLTGSFRDGQRSPSIELNVMKNDDLQPVDGLQFTATQIK